VTLTVQQRTELESVLSVRYDRSVSARVQIVLWWDQGKSAADIATMVGTTKPTVYKWVGRYERADWPRWRTTSPLGVHLRCLRR
jgi:transposase